MDTDTLVVHTTEAPLVAKPRKVRWEISAIDTILGQRMDKSVCFGWPRDMLTRLYGREERPQSIFVKRGGAFLSSERQFRVFFDLHNAKNVRVRWSLAVSSGDDPRVERRIVSDRVCTVEKGERRPEVTFDLAELGEVGRLVERTNRMRLDIELALVAERVDTEHIIKAPGPSLAESIGAGLVSDELRELADAVLVSIDGEEHPAHRLLLSMRSPVMRATFRHDMQESRTGRIHANASSAAVEQLLKFIYTDEVDNLTERDELLLEVFGLASFYELSRLKSLAEAQMLESLSVRNVADRLLLAVRHNSPIKSKCMRIVKGNVAEVMKTKGWQEIAKDTTVMTVLFSEGDLNSEVDGNRGERPKKRMRN